MSTANDLYEWILQHGSDDIKLLAQTVMSTDSQQDQRGCIEALRRLAEAENLQELMRACLAEEIRFSQAGGWFYIHRKNAVEYYTSQGRTLAEALEADIEKGSKTVALTSKEFKDRVKRYLASQG